MNTVKKYKKKPLGIQAMQWDGTFESYPLLYDFAGEFLFTRNDVDFKRTYVYIKTLEGEHLLSPFDFLIKGVFGELYPCKPHIFKETYELLEE